MDREINVTAKQTSTKEAVTVKNAQFKTLIEKASGGDAAALNELCERIANSVLFRVTRIMGGSVDAEDVSQEVMLSMCRKIKTLREPRAFVSWLNRIIQTEVHRFSRNKGNHEFSVDIDEVAESLPETNSVYLPHEYAAKNELREETVKLVDALPGRQRQCVLMHYYDELSLKETADVIGIAPPNVTHHLKQAYEKLKRGFLEMPGVDIQKMSAITFTSMGGLLSDALSAEGASFAAPQAWLQQTLAACGEAAALSAGIAVTAVTAASATSSATGAAAGAATGAAGASAGGAVTVAGFAVIGLMLVSLFTLLGLGISAHVNDEPEYEPLTEVNFIFQGGADLGGGTLYTNPANAVLDFDGRSFEILSWWITRQDDDTIIAEGAPIDLPAVLGSLPGRFPDGTYILHFRVEMDQGGVYSTGRNFAVAASSP